MSYQETDQFDDLIERTLRDEPMRPVPVDFHSRLDERLRVAHVAMREREGFRLRMIASGMLIGAVFMTVLVVPALAFFQGWGVQSYPGALGHMDYIVVFLAQNWGTVVVLAAILGISVLAVSIVAAVAPGLRRKSIQER